MQRIVFLVMWASLHAHGAALPSLDLLFARPYIWGTSPSTPRWSKNGQVLVFRWNSQGYRFLDLYAWNVAARKLTRLTDLESAADDLNVGENEKDERQKQYIPPRPGIAEFDVSNDGKRVAFAHRGDLYLATTDGSRPLLRLTHTKPAESDPLFSSDGTKLASLRGGQIVVQDLATGQIWQVTDVEGGRLTSYLWSPDGAMLLYRVAGQTPRQLLLPNYSGRIVTARSFDRSLPGDKPGDTSLFFVPATGGKPKQLDRGEASWIVQDTFWSPDSRRLLVSQLSPDYRKRRLSVLSPGSSAKVRHIVEEEDPRWVDYGFCSWSDDSAVVLFTSERSGWAQLYRVRAEGGEPAQITRGSFEIRSEPFSQDPQWVKGWIYYSSGQGDTAQRQFWRIRPDGSAAEKLSSGEGLHIGLISEDGRNTAMLRADEKHPFDLWVNNVRVTKSPSAEFESYAWPEVRYVRFPSKDDGRTVAAKLLLPEGYKTDTGSTRKWPAVVYVHGAGIATSVLKQWGSYNELRYVYNAYLTGRGYVVLDLDYRGSTGYGRDWRSDVYLHMGGKDLGDVLGGVDYLKSLGNIDAGRLGIWGVSYGGFMTAMALFQSPGTFKAGSAWAGVYDWENYNAGYTSQRLSTPELHPEAYRRSSPIHFSNRLSDHLLLIHGMVDDNVLFQDAVQLTEKLIHEGKPFEHMYYPEESHGFVREETWIDALRRTTEWFERHLQ